VFLFSCFFLSLGVLIPPILYTSCSGSRRGLSVGRVGGWMASRASNRVVPEPLPSLRVIFQPLNQVIYRQPKTILLTPPLFPYKSFQMFNTCYQ